MPTINIPESAYPAIQSLIRLSASQFDAFLHALSQASPVLDEDKFWTHVVPHVPQIEPPVVRSIVTEILAMAAGLRLTEVEEFASGVSEGAASANSQSFPITEQDTSLLKDRLVKIFQDRKGLRITTKAMGVMLDQDRTFITARILTDIRPVFDQSGESVDAAVIVHNLCIHYAQDTDHKDFYLALDKSDIHDLRRALDRAEVKAKTLETLLKRSEVSYLDAEE